MKKLSDKHVEYLQKTADDNKNKVKKSFLKKISLLLEKYNCTSVSELNESTSVSFIKDMITESDEISDREYLEHTIISSSDPEKVRKAQELLDQLNSNEVIDTDLEDENAESMQNGSNFTIMKDGEKIELTQVSFDKNTGIFTGISGNKEYEYTADEITTETNVPDEIEVYEKWPEPYKSKALEALKSRQENFDEMSKAKLKTYESLDLSSKTQKVIDDLLSIPSRKIKQVINEPSFLKGCFGTLSRYSIELNDESLRMFIESIQRKLEEGEDIEYEFTEEEYQNLMDLKTLPAFVNSTVNESNYKVGDKYHAPAPEGGEAIDFIITEIDDDNDKYTIDTFNKEGRKNNHIFSKKDFDNLVKDSKKKR